MRCCDSCFEEVKEALGLEVKSNGAFYTVPKLLDMVIIKYMDTLEPCDYCDRSPSLIIVAVTGKVRLEIRGKLEGLDIKKIDNITYNRYPLTHEYWFQQGTQALENNATSGTWQGIERSTGSFWRVNWIEG